MGWNPPRTRWKTASKMRTKCFSIKTACLTWRTHYTNRGDSPFPHKWVTCLWSICTWGWDIGHPKKEWHNSLPVLISFLANNCSQKDHLLQASYKIALSNIIPYQNHIICTYIRSRKRLSRALTKCFHPLLNSHIVETTTLENSGIPTCIHTPKKNFQSHLRGELLRIR